MSAKRLKVVLYNPQAVFFTMPLALLAIGSELDPDIYEVVTIDARLDPDAENTVLFAPCRCALPRRDRAHRRSHFRCTADFPGRKARSSGYPGGLGRLAPLHVCQGVPARAVGRRDGARTG